MQGLDGKEHKPNSPAMRRALSDESPPPLDPRVESKPLRFSLREMLVAMTIVATSLALLRPFGIFGLLALFLISVALTATDNAPWAIRDEARQRLLFDFVWGIAMPLLCLAYDPIFLKVDTSASLLDLPDFRELRATALFAYALIGWQMLVLSLWLMCGTASQPSPFFLSGTFAVGSTASVVVAMLLFIPSFAGIIAWGLGLLGFTPWFTSYAYCRRTKLAYALGQQAASRWPPSVLFLAGALVAIVLPGTFGLLAEFLRTRLFLQ